MNRTINLSAAAIFFVGTFGLSTAYAAPSPIGSNAKATEITGCLQQVPAAREYLLQSSDGTTWGIMAVDKGHVHERIRGPSGHCCRWCDETHSQRA
jgi:hypothetical protein